MTEWQARIDEVWKQLHGQKFATPWKTVTQRHADLYCEAVEDPDPMHIDVAWSQANAPYGGTIAPGLWTTSMLVWGLNSLGVPERIQKALDVPYGLNYGFNKLRFVEPLPIGGEFRVVVTPLSFAARDANTALLTLNVVAEIKSAARPAVVGEWLLAFVRTDR